MRVVAELGALRNVRVMPRTTVFGWYDDMVFGAAERVSGHLAAPEAGSLRSGSGASSRDARSWPRGRKSGHWCFQATTVQA